MGNCDSCTGGRKHSKSFDEPVQHTPSSKIRVEMTNEIQVGGGVLANGGEVGVNQRIVPFDDRRPPLVPGKPRKPFGI